MGMIYVFNSGWIVKEIIEQLDNMPIKMQNLESTFKMQNLEISSLTWQDIHIMLFNRKISH